jgi:DNA-directed RNA polymerase subunit RPC12/RpoP
MTVETRRTIELRDILAIEYECSQCGAKTIRTLNEKHAIPGMCGNCSATWIVDGSQEHRDLIVFVNTLRTFPKSSVNAHVRIKLEVAGIGELGT